MHTVRYQLMVDTELQLEQGIDTRTTREILDDLEGLLDKDEGFMLRDELGRDWLVRATNLSTQVRELRQQRRDVTEPAYVVQLDALILNETDPRAAKSG
jgi:hypothetical protein